MVPFKEPLWIPSKVPPNGHQRAPAAQSLRRAARLVGPRPWQLRAPLRGTIGFFNRV